MFLKFKTNLQIQSPRMNTIVIFASLTVTKIGMIVMIRILISYDSDKQ